MDNKFIVKGATIKVLLPTVKGVSKSTGNPYVIKEVVVTLPGDDQYPRELVLKVMKQELIVKLEVIGVGGVVPELEFDPSAREYNGRWYGENKLWRVESEVAQPAQPVQFQQTVVPLAVERDKARSQFSQPQQRMPETLIQQSDDGLPF